MTHRVFGCFWGLATTALGIVATLLAGPVSAQEKPKIRIAHGGQLLNISYPWLEMPAALKYWSQEGYDVEVFIGQSSLQSIQLLVAGQADLAQVNSGPLVQAAAKNDIQLLPVGIGPLAYHALQTDKVQGLMYWGSAIASFENFGGKFRRFYDPNWRQMPDFSLVALKSTIDRDPKAIEAVVRGAAKGSLFALTNPDCARKVQWSYRPASKPTGADEATLVKHCMSSEHFGQLAWQ